MYTKGPYIPAQMDIITLDERDVITCSGEMEEDTDQDQGEWDGDLL